MKPACVVVLTSRFLAEAQGSQRTSLFILLLPQTPFQASRLGEILFVFSRKGAKVAKNFNFYFVLIRNTFAYFAPWRELIVFSSRRSAENAEV